jgi:hypothetical protein
MRSIPPPVPNKKLGCLPITDENGVIEDRCLLPEPRLKSQTPESSAAPGPRFTRFTRVHECSRDAYVIS